MKFRIAIWSLALAFISANALGAPADEYFFPGGLWQGTYTGMCNGKDVGYLTGPPNVTMYVQPLSIMNNSPYNGYEAEYFAGTFTVTGLPADCLSVDLEDPVSLAKGTYASEETDAGPNPIPGPLKILLQTNTGVASPSWTQQDSSNMIEMGFRSEDGTNYINISLGLN